MENKILATVNGQNITEKDLDIAISSFPPERRGFFATENGRKQLLDQMVSFQLIYDDAKEKNLEEEETFKKQLELIKKDSLIQFAIQKVLNSANVSDEDCKKFYDENKESFVSQEKVSAKHILVDTEEEAKDIKNDIEKGMSFEEAAEKNSKCPSKAQGGSLGEFTRGQMVPEFEEAAFNMEIGVVSEPVKTQFGYHLIKVEDKAEKQQQGFDEVKEVLKNKLLQQKQQETYFKFIEDLGGKYKVEYK